MTSLLSCFKINHVLEAKNEANCHSYCRIEYSFYSVPIVSRGKTASRRSSKFYAANAKNNGSF